MVPSFASGLISTFPKQLLRNTLLLAFCLGVAQAAVGTEPTKPSAEKKSATALQGLVTPELWRDQPRLPISAEEIDSLVEKALASQQIKPAPLTTDEQFLRRVYLDVTGQLPTPNEVRDFVADKNMEKRAKVIDKLLSSDDYPKHWARYWREVIVQRASDNRLRALVPAFQNWLVEEIKQNKSWSEITRALLTAEGEIQFGDGSKNGQAFFLLSRMGADAPNERAAETARVFLGIQLQCAQCHNHPFDQWKQEQFHEFAAYFARLRDRLVREKDSTRFVGVTLFATPFGEQQMPDKDNPQRKVTVMPKYLDGKSPAGRFLNDKQRREALADSITDKNNFWFAGAYVNRLWGELMGQGFYQPIDDMGPQKEAVFPHILARTASAFRGSDYDTKALLKVLLNTKTYQRQTKLGDSLEQHLHFASSYPTRLRADALWNSLVSVLGNLNTPFGFGSRPGAGGAGPGRGFGFGLEAQFKEEFAFDPSAKPDEVQGSIPQALLLMNNPTIADKVQARGANVLARLLEVYPQDDEALRMLYLKTLSRKPTDRERDKAHDYLKKVGNRTEAFEDLLWVLLNSTEFQTKR